MKDGSIESNKATNGAGVYVESKSTKTEAKFQMEGGSIEKNEATGNGGGVYAYESSGTVTVIIDDSFIIDNAAGSGYKGGGLYVYYGSEAIINNTEITGNTASQGDSIYVAVTSNCEVTDGTMDKPIFVATGTATYELTETLSYSTVDMADYIITFPSCPFTYSATTGAGTFSDSVFTPTTSGGDFVLKAVDGEDSAYGYLNFSMDKKASSSSSSYYIKATATGNGTVAPEDEDVSADSMYKVSKGSDVTFEFDADSGYEVTDVIVNGASVGALDEYEFENIIDKMQTLEVVFEKSSSSSSSSDDDDDDEDVDDDDDDADEREVPFADVDTDDDNYDGIVYVYENGIMAGISSDVFGGELSITRGMIAAILFRINGSETVDADELFGDVDSDQYYAEAVKWGKSAGVMAGVSETEFAPNTAITVEQFLAFLYRYASFLGMDMDVDGDTDLTGYGITDYAYNAVLWAVENDIIDEGDLTPTAEALRGDVATGLMNFMDMM